MLNKALLVICYSLLAYMDLIPLKRLTNNY